MFCISFTLGSSRKLAYPSHEEHSKDIFSLTPVWLVEFSSVCGVWMNNPVKVDLVLPEMLPTIHGGN